MYAFDRSMDYKTEFANMVDELIELNIEDRQHRIEVIDELCECYVRDIGKTPAPYQLERLANYILREELLDKKSNKANEDYSFQSDSQLDRRVRKEIQLQNMEETIDQDGKQVSDGKTKRGH